MSVLVIAEHENGSLKSETSKTVTAASKINSNVTVLVLGQNVETVANEAAQISGVSKVLVVDNSVFDNMLAETVAEFIASIASDYTHILASATTTGKNFLPRVAALLDKAQISDIVDVIDENTFKRPIYAGNAIATVKSLESLKLITVRATAFDKSAEQPAAPVEVLSASVANTLSQFVGQEVTESERPELTAADVIISGGRGMQNGENFALLNGIADKLNAAIGASRAAVDAGFVPNDMQVGQTGKIVAPNLYIAVGISGAIQHLAGMKDSKVIVAINKDPDAPIFQVADYGLVADLFDVLPELEKAL
jgi:electron transfer flavoprotein alpha subunit